MSVLKVAIIGQGRSGRDIHGAQLKQDSERFKIVAVVDPLVDRRDRAEREYGCEVYSDYSQLNSRTDLDLVVNSSPSRYHVPITLDLLESGFNVLCEKPFAATTAEVNRMIEASLKSGKVLAVFQQSRYAPYFQKVKDVIASGVLGDIVQINIAFNGFSRRYDWQTLTSEIGGNLHNTGPHPLDQALQLFGGVDTEAPHVHCIMRNTISYGDADDHTLLLLTGEGKPIIHLEISSCCTYPGPTYQLYGKRGGLKGDTRRLEWRYYDPAAAPEIHLVREPISKSDGSPSYCTDNLDWIKEEWEAPSGPGLFEYMCNEYYSMLYNTIVDGAPLQITLAEVRRQIQVMEECRRQNPHIWTSHFTFS
jgi:predicted dehydrogenase